MGIVTPRRRGSSSCGLRRVGMVSMMSMVRPIVRLGVDQVVDARDILLLCSRRITSSCGRSVLLLGGLFRHWLLLARNSGTFVTYGSG